MKMSLLIVLIACAALVASMAARVYIIATFKKNLNRMLHRKKAVTAYALAMLELFDAKGIRVMRTNPFADTFRPKSATLYLCDLHDSYSICSLATALHECGHAVVFSRRNPYYSMLFALSPLFHGAAYLAIPLLIASLIAMDARFAVAALAIFDFVFAFNLLALPSEIAANGYAKKAACALGCIREEEAGLLSALLFASALAATASTFAVFSEIGKLFKRMIVGSVPKGD